MDENDKMDENDERSALERSVWWLTESWGKYITEWVLLDILIAAGDEGIPYDKIDEAFRDADSERIQRNYRANNNIEPGSKLDQEFDYWLISAHAVWGMRLPPALAERKRRLEEARDNR